MEFTKADIKREKLRRIMTNKHAYYVPTGVSEQFINAVFGGKYFISLYSAANGVGKTCMGANTLANLFWPTGNPFFQQELMQRWPYPKKGRIVTEPTTITSTIIPELKAWFPAGRYTMDKKGKNYEYHWKTDTGWEFDIMSYDQDIKEFESATLGFIWLDEPPPELIYKACVSRLRRGGIMMITATPLTGSAWMYDQIISNPDHENGYRFYVEAGVESACELHGERGFLNHDHIERMISEYSEEDKQARIHGRFQHLTGLIYKQFSRKVHVIRPFNVNLKDYTVYEALDPHPRNPDAIVWIAVDKYGQKFQIDELYVKCQDGTKELAQRIKQKASQYRVVRRVADPKAFEVDQHDERGRSLADKLAEHGLVYQPATKYRTASDRRIADALDYQKTGDEFIVSPEYYIFDHCQRTIFEFEHYRWQEWTGKAVDQHDKKEKRVDKDDHMIECIGRILIQEPQFEPMIVEREDDFDRGGIIHGSDDPYY